MTAVADWWRIGPFGDEFDRFKRWERHVELHCRVGRIEAKMRWNHGKARESGGAGGSDA